MTDKIHELTNEELEQVNGGSDPYNGPTTSYYVVPGDCLWNIAQKFGTTVAVLMELNPRIENADYIQAGWTITVPDTQNQ